MVNKVKFRNWPRVQKDRVQKLRFSNWFCRVQKLPVHGQLAGSLFLFNALGPCIGHPTRLIDDARNRNSGEGVLALGMQHAYHLCSLVLTS